MMSCLLRLAIVFLGICASICDGELNLKVVTVATEETDGYLRFMRSINMFDLDVEVFGLHEEWRGGDMMRGPGGGHKINILREGLKKYRNDGNLLLMFTDSYDVVFTAGIDEIMKRFKRSGARILISAEDFCWPDTSLADKYPAFEEDGYKFLCSGGIIGYAPEVYDLITAKVVNHTDDDQLYYTQIYLNDREKQGIKLDRRADLFQNLNGNQAHVELRFDGSDASVVNTRFQTTPIVIHGNGPSKTYLNHLANYVPRGYTPADGCLSCKEDTIVLNDIPKDKWPTVLIGLFITAPTPFVDSFLHQISNLDYPKDRLDVFIHNMEDYHANQVEAWIKEFDAKYNSITYKGPHNFLKQEEGRNMGIFLARKSKVDYYFSVDGAVSLSNRKTLQILIEQNRSFLTPMLSKVDKYWSNFWGSIDSEGWYKRSPDYLDIVRMIRRGVWNAPFVSNAYLIKATTLNQMSVQPFSHNQYDVDMEFVANNREKGVFMYVINIHHYGHLKELSTYTTKQKHNDMYQLFDNKLDWEDRYLHPRYTEFLDPNSEEVMPCQDVFWFPAVTKNFTRELIEECENFGEWSGGGHKDPRIAGGYENVPTVDIHMNQIGFEKHWLQMLKAYFAPMATRLYAGYHPHAQSHMNFVVKYNPSGQYFLRPHHDASTWTVNVALNEVGVDYEGGGSRFLRYNCSVSDTKVGWSLIHPGRLTHQHEGLPTTKGTRYIMVSFVDP